LSTYRITSVAVAVAAIDDAVNSVTACS